MEKLYHYCSCSKFESIVSSRNIFLSSLSLSNDSLEGKLVSKTFERLLINENISNEEINAIKENFNILENLFDGYGFCLSEKPDLLSQWRGYADDGRGFSIGFSKDYLKELIENQDKITHTLFLNHVLYNQDEQEEVLNQTYQAIKNMIEEGKLKRPKRTLLTMVSDDIFQEQNKEYIEASKKLLLKIFQTLPNFFIFKSQAFKEEAEWRLYCHMVQDDHENRSFYALNNRIIPYRPLELIKLTSTPIIKIYLGPKNITPIPVVQSMLKKYGFGDVEVKRSSASYR